MGADMLHGDMDFEFQAAAASATHMEVGIERAVPLHLVLGGKMLSDGCRNRIFQVAVPPVGGAVLRAGSADAGSHPGMGVGHGMHPSPEPFGQDAGPILQLPDLVNEPWLHSNRPFWTWEGLR